MHKLMMIGCMVAVALGETSPAQGAIICSGESDAVRVTIPTPTTVSKTFTINALPYASPWGGAGEDVIVTIDGAELFSTTNQTETAYRWQPLTTGSHTLTCTFGTNVLTKTLRVTALDFYVTPAPNPPMAKDGNISITPTTRNFGVNGGGNSIITSGSGTWAAAASDPWITLNATGGNVGYPVAYTVSANTNVEQRTGYVYVSGWVHTVTQDGVGGTISPKNRTFEHQGGRGTIAVSAANRMVWQARPDVDWLSVTPTKGMGEGSVTYTVAPYNEVATRQGTLTVAGNTFTVFQYGRRMKLEPSTVTQDYEAHVIPITVNALAATTWNVRPNNSWISIVDGGNGQGGDLVTIAIAENPSYKARTGTVTIGTETFTVTQQGRPTEALSFNVSPVNSTASVNGANGLIAVTATPDLPWTATSGANWITIYAAAANGAGNGNVVYNASPNPTLFERTGKVTVTPEKASGMAAKTHTVTQPAAESSLSMGGYEFEASGAPCSVSVSVSSIVQWSVVESLDWITVNGSTSRVGPGTVTLQAAANNTVYPRSGTVMIAGKTFSVSQKARSVELEYETMLFPTDGGSESISIHPDGNVSWTAVASDPTWITIFQGDSGTGDGEIMYIVAPYVGNGEARTGWIEVGDEKVFISQRPYELSISPNGSEVPGNNGAGEFGVAADIGAIWNAIVTEPWITIVSGYDAGTGSGTVRFICEDNYTGQTRVGKIVVAGEVHTVKQAAQRIKTFTVTFNANGGAGGATRTLAAGSAVGALPVPLLIGGIFDGWFTTASGGERVTETTMVTGDVTYYAHWIGWEYRVTGNAAKISGVESSPTGPLTIPVALGGYPVTSIGTSALEGCDGVTSVTMLDNVTSIGDRAFAWCGCLASVTIPSSVTSIGKDAFEFCGALETIYVEEGDAENVWAMLEQSGFDPRNVTFKELSAVVRFDANGGSASVPYRMIVSGDELGELPAAVWGGHTFNGWYTAKTGGTKVSASTKFTGNATVYARWTVNKYRVAFSANGGSVSPTHRMVEYCTTYGELPTPTWSGHTFNGWFTAKTGGSQVSASTKCTGNATIYAHWTVNQYKVSFSANGGSVSPTYKMVDYCATYGTLPTPTWGGHEFQGWFTAKTGGSQVTSSTKCTGGATVYARWTVKQYKVSFSANGGTVTPAYKMVDYCATYGELPTPTWGGHTFNGWFTAKTGGTQVSASTKCTGGATVYARWTVNQYKLSFSANGGSVSPAYRMVDYCATYGELPTPTWSSAHTFNGWFTARTGGTQVTSATKCTGNATIYAQWTVKQYTITFNANGGSVSPSSQNVNYCATYTLPTPTWDGHAFDGWWTAKTGGTQVVSPAKCTGNATLYAHWK